MSESSKSEPFGDVVNEVSERAGQWSYPYCSAEVTVGENGESARCALTPKISRLSPWECSRIRAITNTIRFGLVPLMLGRYGEKGEPFGGAALAMLDELEDLDDIMDTVWSTAFNVTDWVYSALLAWYTRRPGHKSIHHRTPWPWEG